MGTKVPESIIALDLVTLRCVRVVTSQTNRKCKMESEIMSTTFVTVVLLQLFVSCAFGTDRLRNNVL